MAKKGTASTIATAYVQIEPSMDGVTGKLESGFGIEGKNAGSSFASAFTTGMGGVVTAAAGATVAAVGATTAAVGGLTKEAVENYAEYEQLVGGVETLFGTGGKSLEEYAKSVDKTVEEAKSDYNDLQAAQEMVFKNASVAYKEAGMSVNEYMENVTGFAASLIQSTGKGEQTNIDELKAQLEEEYIATKRSLQDQYDARKESYKGQADLIKSSSKAEVDALKAQRKAELDSLKKGDKTAYEAAKKSWDERIELAQKGASAEKTALSNVKSTELKDLKRANEDELRALKQHHKDLIAEAEAANNYSEKTPEAVAEAARIANIAAVDMSDNANKMGSAIEAIQNAYQGFAKQNYTMLDNLKLGYGGTKEEMERLLADASRLKGVDFSLNKFDDVIMAIHASQEEQGIAGTTQEEAASTIKGSLEMTKKAWDNLLTGIADGDADIESLISNLVESGKAAFENLTPVIENALMGVASFIDKIVPVLMDRIPNVIATVLPKLIDTVTNAVGTIFTAVIDNLPGLIDTLGMVLNEIGTKLTEVLPSVAPKLATALVEILNTLLDNLTALSPVIFGLVQALGEGLLSAFPILLPGIAEFIQSWADTMSLYAQEYSWADMIIAIFGAIAQLLISNMPLILDSLGTILGALIQYVITFFIPQCLLLGVMIINSLGESIRESARSKLSDIGEMIIMLLQDSFSKLETIFAPVVPVIETVINTIINMWNGLKETLSPLLESIKYLVETIFTGIGVVITTILTGISSKVLEIFEGIKNAISEKLGLLIEFVKPYLEQFLQFISEKLDKIKELFSGMADKAQIWGSDLLKKFIEGIKSKIGDLSETIIGIADKIREIIGFSEPEIGPLSNFHTFAPDMMKLFAKGIQDNEDVVIAQVKSSFDFGEQISGQNRGAIDAALSGPAYAPVESVVSVEAQNNSELSGQFAQAVTLLGQLVDKDPVEIGANAAGIFDLVRKQNNMYLRANGRGALA